MKILWSRFFLWMPLLLWSASSLQARTWKNKKGKTVQATLLSVEGDKVKLKAQNGRVYPLKIESLSQKDQDFIKKWQEKQANDATGKKENDAKPLAAGFIDNFENEWPTLISLERGFEISTISEEKGKYVYHSPRYEFIADVKLRKSVVKRFAELFEATHQYMQKLPISSQKAQDKEKIKRNRILLFETKDAYHRAGGPQGSAGVFMGGRNVIMVPLTSLGVKKVGKGYSVDRDKNNKTLPHEITHMICDGCYYAPGAMGWFSEGLAEYVGVTPYRSGKYIVRGNLKAVREYVTSFDFDTQSGRSLTKNIQVRDLKSYMFMPYSDFTADGNKNYGVGLLMTYYFFHMDDKGSRKRINNFLRALQQGKRGQEAVDFLLDGRTYKELAKDISNAWRSRGIKLKFG